MVLLFGLVVIGLTFVAIYRRIDVRVALVLAALALAVIAGLGDAAQIGGEPAASARRMLLAFVGPIMRIVRTFLATFSDERFVVPICSSMGFAYVLRETGCDQHLVHLLSRPLRSARGLFLPGMVLIGFVVNMPLISQASTAVAVGIVLIPLGRAVGFSPCVLASALVLGASIGGELLNPGAPELRTVVDRLNEGRATVTSADCVAQVRGLLGWHLLVATIVFWWLNRGDRSEPAAELPGAEFRVNYFRAVVPFIPLALLIALSPPFQVWQVPRGWLLLDPASAVEAKQFDSRLIGAAMLLGVAVATLSAPRSLQAVGQAFFGGAGYAFTSIVAIIVAANCFGEGFKLIGLDVLLGRLIHALPQLLLPLAGGVPLLFGLVSGSGMATTQSLFGLFVDPSYAVGVDPIRTGAVVSIAAAAGRTMSPVSAVALMGGKLTDVSPLDISRRVMPPLLAGLIVLVALAMWRAAGG